jgi:hypothetical protein
MTTRQALTTPSLFDDSEQNYQHASSVSHSNSRLTQSSNGSQAILDPSDRSDGYRARGARRAEWRMTESMRLPTELPSRGERGIPTRWRTVYHICFPGSNSCTTTIIIPFHSFWATTTSQISQSNMAPIFLFMDDFCPMLNTPWTEFNEISLKFMVKTTGPRRDF